MSDHIRALMAPQPADVASSDRHTVKPWFNGRIPESPRVVDLARNDIDVVKRNPVPALVYHHRKHLISLTAIPAPGKPDTAPVSHAIEGYNIIEWTADGVTYWAVSDVAAPELAHFTEQFRSTPSDP